MELRGKIPSTVGAPSALARAASRAPTKHVEPQDTGDACGPVQSASRPVETTANGGESDEISSSGRDDQVRVPVQFGAITASNIEKLRTLNVHIFPVRYNDTFYGDVLFVPKGYAQFAYWEGLVVGAICCRHEPVDAYSANARQKTYIMTLGVLEPYRHYKIGSALLQQVIRLSERDGVDHIYLHVQTNNDAALRFYRNFGFTVRDTIRNYYKRLQPPDCFVLVKQLAGDM